MKVANCIDGSCGCDPDRCECIAPVSTLERAAEIEQDFYALKAQQWACEPHEAQEKITDALIPVRAEFILRRHPLSDDELTRLVRGEP